MDFLNLLNQYPNLSEAKVSLSDLGVAHRTFFNWKEKGIIDYDHKFTPDDIVNNVKRKKVELNAFEALWVLIIKELRLFNIGLNTIAGLKSYLFSNLDLDFLKDMSIEAFDQSNESNFSKDINTYLKAHNFTPQSLHNLIENIPDSNKNYLTPIGFMMSSIVVSGQSPSVFIHKKPVDKQLSFDIYNPTLESIYYKDTNEDYRTELINRLTENTIVNIPVRPLFVQFFQNKSLLKYAKDFDLFTPGELKILRILNSKDFNKIIIHKNNDNQITIECNSSEEVLGHAAQELRKTLGLKEYQRTEVIFRNNKNLVLNNITKQKIDLGNP